MNEPLPSRAKELEALSRQMLRVSVGLLTGCTNVETWTHTVAGLLTAGMIKTIVYMWYVIVRHLHQQLQTLGSYVLEAQGSKKHEGEW
jgi:hypothetical protein